jgi:pimeloyl-ACP methyl ester carboxylesterase
MSKRKNCGMQLSTTTSGSGPRHVGLVHGLGASGPTWQPLVDLMLTTGDFTVTTLDLRGHGSSDRSTSYTIDALADDVVENLPVGLHSIVGHSLGGAVVARAVSRLSPGRAIYLDPGFRLALPTTGFRGRVFWLAPTLSLVLAQVGQARASKKVQAGYSPEVLALLKNAQSQFDKAAAIDIFRDVAFHPLKVERPDTPSTVVLSDDSPAVVPEATARALISHGWDVRRLRDIHHDMQLEDPERVFDTLRDIL